MKDLQYAIRLMDRSRGFTAVAVLTLALGVGVNTAIFNFADSMLFRPLPFAEPSRLVMLKSWSPETGIFYGRVDRVDYEQFAAHHQGLSGIALIEGGPRYTWLGSDGAAAISSLAVSSNLLTVLGVGAAVGRPVGPGDEQLDPRPAMLTYGAWRRRFGADPTAVGRVITFDQARLQIVGVLPESFIVPQQGWFDDRDLLVPVAPRRSEIGNPRAGISAPIARLKRGVSLAQAQAEVDTLVRRAAMQYPETAQNRAIKVVDLQYGLFDLNQPMLWQLVGAAGFVLLIACANVASLLMARGTRRDRELAVRAAIGGSRARLVRQLLVESLVLGAFGAVAALAVAGIAFDLLATNRPGSFTFVTAGLGLRGVAFASACAIGSALVFGIAPALRFSRPDLMACMRSTTGSSSRAAMSAGALLVTSEVALGLILLCGAGLMANSLIRMRTVDLGFEPDRVLTLIANPPLARYPSRGERFAYQMELLRRVRGLTGVAGAAAIDTPQFGSFAPPSQVNAGPGREYGLWGSLPGAFAVAGTPILDGRDFTDREVQEEAPVAIVNESVARQLWPDRSAVNQLLMREKLPPLTIVGVVKDVRQGYGRPRLLAVYRPLPRQEFKIVGLLIKVDGDPRAAAVRIRAAAQSIDPRIVIEPPRPLAADLSGGLAESRFQTIVLSIFAVLGAVLAAVGIYGVVGFWVAGRTREMGIRLALGAAPRDLQRMVVLESARSVVAGLAIGVTGSFLATRQIQSLLYGITPHDPTTFLAVSALLFAVGLAAAYVPARRAARVDPNLALRAE